jgi:hypothetical protein
MSPDAYAVRGAGLPGPARNQHFGQCECQAAGPSLGATMRSSFISMPGRRTIVKAQRTSAGGKGAAHYPPLITASSVGKCTSQLMRGRTPRNPAHAGERVMQSCLDTSPKRAMAALCSASDCTSAALVIRLRRNRSCLDVGYDEDIRYRQRVLAGAQGGRPRVPAEHLVNRARTLIGCSR